MVKTAQELKKAVNSPDKIKLAQNLFMAMAWVETVRPIVTEYQMDILQDHQWKADKEWSEKHGINEPTILTPNRTYLLNDEDAKVYYQECFEAAARVHLPVKEVGYCPLLIAEHNVVKAEWALFDAMKDITGIDGHELYGKNREKYLDLLLSMFAPLVKTGVEACKQYRAVSL
jgi:hypothetical protein